MPSNSKIFYVGPTNQDAMEIMWEDLDERFYDLRWKCRGLISKQRFEFSGRRQVVITGAEKIRRARGRRLYRAYLDEIAFYQRPLGEIWRAIRPSLTDLRGGAIVSTTPNGKGTDAYRFYLETLKKENWNFHHWMTIQNPYIDPDEIEEARNELDEKSFNQEYMAKWESFEGLAYYNFDENIHVKKQPPISDDYPVILHLDFNVNPTTLIIGQQEPDMYRFKLEYSFKDSSTIDTMKSFCEDHKHKKEVWRLKVRGDATGHSRKSTTGYSDYHYVEEMLHEYGFNYELEMPGQNPPIVDRVSHVNGYLKNVKGFHRVEFDPKCTDTIIDLSSQALNGRFPSDKNNLGHKADAIGYGIWWDYINKTRSKQRTILL